MKALLHDRRGAISVFAVGVMLLLIGMTALTVDVGLWYLKRRDLQAATDAAALAAVQNPAATTATAGAMLTANGFAAANVNAVTMGFYCVNPAVPAANRFSATAASGCTDAVRVESFADVPLFFARPFLSGNSAMRRLHITATAIRIDAAGLRAGTAVASVSTADALLMNATFDSLLGGTNVGLSAAHYSALAGIDVGARGLLGALAAKVGVSGGTYRQLLAANASVDDVLDAAIAALSTPGSAADAATAIAGLQLLRGKVPAVRTIAIGKLFHLGAWQDMAIGGPAAINGGLNALQIASAAFQLANGQNAAAAQQTVTLPGGLARATLEVSAIEPPQDAYFAFGPKGTSVHTAQMRLKLNMQIIGQLVQLPLYVELGSGDARIAGINCGPNAGDAQVSVAGRSAAANVYIGTVSAGPSAMKNFSTPVSVSPAWLLNLSVPLVGPVGVGFSAHVPIGAGAETIVTFTSSGAGPTIGAPPAPGNKGQVVSTGLAGSLSSGLLGSLTLATSPVGLGGVVAALSPVTSLINNTIKPLLALLDPTLDTLVKALGLKLGFMELWVPGVRCGVPVLVT